MEYHKLQQYESGVVEWQHSGLVSRMLKFKNVT